MPFLFNYVWYMLCFFILAFYNLSILLVVYAHSYVTKILLCVMFFIQTQVMIIYSFCHEVLYVQYFILWPHGKDWYTLLPGHTIQRSLPKVFFFNQNNYSCKWIDQKLTFLLLWHIHQIIYYVSCWRDWKYTTHQDVLILYSVYLKIW